MNINPAGLNFQDIKNDLVPQDGPKGAPLLLDFSGIGITEYDLDLTIPRQQNRISMIQTIYIDTSNSDTGITVICGGTNQNITVKGRTQGFYPVAIPNEPTLRFLGTASTTIYQVILFNIPIAGVNWVTQ